ALISISDHEATQIGQSPRRRVDGCWTSYSKSSQSMRLPAIFPNTVLLYVLSSAATAHGAGTYYQVQYPPSTAADELQVGVTYTIWITDGVQKLRGVIVHQH